MWSPCCVYDRLSDTAYSGTICFSLCRPTLCPLLLTDSLRVFRKSYYCSVGQWLLCNGIEPQTFPLSRPRFILPYYTVRAETIVHVPLKMQTDAHTYRRTHGQVNIVRFLLSLHSCCSYDNYSPVHRRQYEYQQLKQLAIALACSLYILLATG